MNLVNSSMGGRGCTLMGMAWHGMAWIMRDATSCTSPAFFRLQVMGNWWTWLRRTPSDSGRMQRSDDDTADERFLLLDYEHKQRFERQPAKLHACSFSLSLAAYCLGMKGCVVTLQPMSCLVQCRYLMTS